MKVSIFLLLTAAVQSISSFGLRPPACRTTGTTSCTHAQHSRVPVYPTTCRQVLALFSSESVDEEPQPRDSQRLDLTRKYNTTSLLFMIVSVIIALMPDRTVQLASKVGGAAGYGLASGVSRILAGATNRNRLDSDTYKRLNMGLFGFSLVSLVAIPGEAAFLPTFGMAVLLLSCMQLVKGLGLTVANEGWRRGVDPENNGLDPKQIMGELGNGTKSNLGGLYNTPRTGFMYLLCFLFSLAGGLSSYMEGRFYMSVSCCLNKSCLWLVNASSYVCWLFISTIFHCFK